MDTEGKRDSATVTAAGERLVQWIDGVLVRALVTHEDERGELTELYDPRWGLTDQPLVYAYQTMVRPGKAKGWVMHEQQTDRLAVHLGVLRVVLYDGRGDSATHGRVNVIVASERNRRLLTIPPGVWHAVQNIGQTDSYFLNFPTRPYNHADPDKRRLPLDTDQIPFRLELGPGW